MAARARTQSSPASRNGRDGAALGIGGSRPSMDFRTAMQQRREAVEDEGETWESAPRGTAADIDSKRQDRAMKPVSRDSGGYRKTVATSDFRDAMRRQRATVDHRCALWENAPKATDADCINTYADEGSDVSRLRALDKLSLAAGGRLHRSQTEAADLRSQTEAADRWEERPQSSGSSDALDLPAKAEVPAPSAPPAMRRASSCGAIERHDSSRSRHGSSWSGASRISGWRLPWASYFRPSSEEPPTIETWQSFADVERPAQDPQSCSNDTSVVPGSFEEAALDLMQVLSSNGPPRTRAATFA